MTGLVLADAAVIAAGGVQQIGSSLGAAFNFAAMVTGYAVFAVSALSYGWSGWRALRRRPCPWCTDKTFGDEKACNCRVPCERGYCMRAQVGRG